MRFIVMHKVDAHMEAGDPPDQRIIQRMGSLVQGSIKSGVFENGAGLHRSAQRVRVEFSGGQRTVTKGPLTGGNQLIASCYMVKADAMEQAIDHASRFAKVWGDVEIEIGPVVEPWDLGLMPAPAEKQPGRFLLLRKGDVRTESGAAEASQPALEALKKQLTEEGVLLMSEKLGPSSKGARLAAGPKAKRAWVDGPFAESKELIAGFSILNLPSKAEAIAWADKYAGILGDSSEVDVRELE